MRTAAVAFFLSLAIAGVLTPVLRELAVRLNLVDEVGSARKIHARPVPRLGGIAIVIAFFSPLVGLLILETSTGDLFLADPRRAFGLFIGGGLIALLGVYDDVKGVKAWVKLSVQVPVAMLMYWLGFKINVIANPFGDPIPLGILGLPLTVMWVVGLVNAMNLIDGLDGLAGGVSLFAISVTLIIALMKSQPLMILFCAALAGSVLGFLAYNFNPATIFMGDTGSMFLGFVIAITSIQVNQKSSTAVAILVPIVALGLPLLDTSLAFLRRSARGKSPFSADREHIHHRLLDLGLSQRQAAGILYIVCLLLAFSALALTFAGSGWTVGLLSLLAVGAFVFVRRLGLLRRPRRRLAAGIGNLVVGDPDEHADEDEKDARKIA